MFSVNQSLILAILSENPEREYHLQELGRLVGKKPGVFQRGINSLEKQDLILSRKFGGLRLFRINLDHPLSKEIKAMTRKTSGAQGDLKKILDKMTPVVTALIYGSYAKDSLRTDSDIDLLVVADGPKAEDEIVKQLAVVEKKFGRDVNYKFYRETDFDHRRKNKDPFLAEVLSDKYILLKGSL